MIRRTTRSTSGRVGPLRVSQSGKSMMTVIETARPEAATTGALSGEAYRVAMRRWLSANLPASFRSDQRRSRRRRCSSRIAWEAAMYRAGLAGITWPQAYGGHGRTLARAPDRKPGDRALAMPKASIRSARNLRARSFSRSGPKSRSVASCRRSSRCATSGARAFPSPKRAPIWRAADARHPHGDTWRINGQKVWTSGHTVLSVAWCWRAPGPWRTASRPRHVRRPA
jgi:hypothetical protein